MTTYTVISSKNGKEIREDGRMSFETSIKQYEYLIKCGEYDEVKVWEVGNRFDSKARLGTIRNWNKNQVKP